MANLSNINNKFLFTDGDFLKIGNLAPINNISGTESGISVTNSNVASITLDNTAASGKRYVMYSAGNGSLVFWDGDASSARLQIDTSGNSTFGGTVQATQFTATNGLNYLKRNTDASLQLRSENTRSGLFITKPATDTVMGSALVMADESYRFGTANYYHQVMLQDGNTYFNQNVGIGTTSPQNDKLHVETDTSTVYDGNSNQTGGLFVNNIYHEALNTFSQIRLGVSGASGASTVRLVGIEPSQAASDFAVVLRDGSVWGEKLRIKGATGNVGIGTDAPGSKLQVEGTVFANGEGNGFILDTGTAATARTGFMKYGGSEGMIISGNNTKVRLAHRTDSDYVYGGTPTIREDLVIDTTGNVGIGTASPNIGTNTGTAILTLKNTGTNRAVLNMTSTTPGTGVYAQEAFYNGGVLKTLVQHVGDGSTDSGYIKWFTTASGGSTTERMRITSSGKVVVQGENFVIDDVREHREEFVISGTSAYNFDVDIKNIGASGQPFEVFIAFTHYSTSYGAAYHAAYYQRSTVQSDITLIHQYFNQNSTRGGTWTVTYLSATQIRISKSAGVGGSTGYGYLRVTQVDF